MKNFAISKKTLPFVLVLLVSVFFIGGTKQALAGHEDEPPEDTRVSAFTITPSDTRLGVTNSYTVSFTLNTSIPTQEVRDGQMGVPMWIGVNMSGGNCPPNADWQECQPDFSNATISGVSATLSDDQWSDSVLNFVFNNALSAGTTTFTINTVQNPSFGGGYYQGVMGINSEDVDPGEGGTWPQEQSSSFILGSAAFYGKILAPDGSVVSNVGANLRSQDFSFNQGTGVNDEGNFLFLSSGLGQGTTYTLEVWVSNDVHDYVAPTPLTVTYSGSATNLGTIRLAEATKTITGRVTNNLGEPVTTAQINAWRPGIGGSGNGTVNANGEYELLVAPGEWELNPSPTWDEETQQQVSVNWTYNQQSQRVSFTDDSSEETRTVNFTVQKTNAAITGRALLPNGTALTSGWVDIRTGDGPGMGSGINQDGRFTANVSAGSYVLGLYPDSMNTDLARYYFSEMKVTVGPDETLALGDLTLSQKTSAISGKVTLQDGTAVSGVRVNCWNRNGSGWTESTTADDGTYTAYLFAGQWECQMQTGRDSDYIPVRAGGEPTVYDLSDNETISNVNYVVQVANAWINVRTVDVDGNAITDGMYGGVYARIKGANFGPGSEYNSGLDRGTATIPVLGDETYVVGTWLSPESGYLLDSEEEVEVLEGETVDALLTLVEPDAEIVGYLKDQDGKAVTGVEAEIWAQPAATMGPGGGANAHTRVNTDDGSFTLRVRGGEKYMLGFWMRNNSDFLQSPPEFQPFDVAVNGTVTKVLTAFRANTYADVTLLDPDGQKVDFGFGWCSNRRWMEDKARGEYEGGKIVDTGSEIRDGVGRIPLISGQYECGAGQWKDANEYMPPEIVEIEVTPSSPASVTLQFREADAYIVGNVTFENSENAQMGFCHAWQEEGGFSGGDVFDGEFRVPLTLGTWFVGCDSYNPQDNNFFRSTEAIVNITERGEITMDFVLSEAGFDIPEGFTTTFDATQQQVITLPDDTVVTIPANALADSGNVTFTASPDTSLYFTKNDKPFSYAWNLEALNEDGTLIESFNSNVSILIFYDQALLDEQGIDETNIIGKYWNESTGTWELPEGITQDTDNDTVNLSVSHFTNFALTTSESTGVSATVAQGEPVNLVATPSTSGGPQVGVYNKDGDLLATWFAYSSSLRVGVTALSADLDGDGESEVITYPEGNASAQVRVFDKNGQVLSQFVAGNGLTTIDLAINDLNGDGSKEIIVTNAGSGNGDIWIYDRNGRQLTNVIPGMSRPANVAAADLNGDGTGEIVIYPVTGSGQVRIWDNDGNSLAQFHAYGETYNKGINLTLEDLDGDGNVEIITTTKDAVAHVKVFDRNGNVLAQFMGYSETFKGGAKATTGDVDGDGDKEIILLPGTAGSAQARVFDKDGNLLSQFFAYSPTIRGTFDAVVGDVDNDGEDEIAFAPAVGLGSQVRIFDRNGNALSQFFTLHQGFRGGMKLTTISQ